MDMENYKVEVSRVSKPWFFRSEHRSDTKSFYVPKVRRLGRSGDYEMVPFLEQYPTAWGFESEAEAWQACDAHCREDWNNNADEYYLSHGPVRIRECEDFHSDG